MTISIIVPLYFGTKYTNRIIEMIELNALNAELVGDVEIVFVNDSPQDPVDASLDSEIGILIRVINNRENLGIHGARVKGLLEAEGQYVTFLDQDDEVSPYYIKNMLPCVKNADVAICNGIAGGRQIYSSEQVMQFRLSKEACLSGRNGIVSPGQILIRRECIPEIWRDNTLKHNGADDYFLYLLLLLHGNKIKIFNQKLYRHVTTGSNTGRNNMMMAESVDEMSDILLRHHLIDDQVYQHIRKHAKFFEDANVLRRDQTYMYILDLWLELEEKNIRVADYFINRNISNIVVYGAGVLGRHLIRQIHRDIAVDAVLDKGVMVDLGEQYDIPVMKPNDYKGNAKLMVITPTVYFDEIRKSVAEIYDGEIIALDVLLEGMMTNLEW